MDGYWDDPKTPSDPSPISPRPTPPRGMRVLGGTLGIVGTLALALITLSLASCVSFFTTCSTDPTKLFGLHSAQAKAEAYWSSKYGERERASSAAFPAYAGLISVSHDYSRVVVRMGGTGKGESGGSANDADGKSGDKGSKGDSDDADRDNRDSQGAEDGSGRGYLVLVDLTTGSISDNRQAKQIRRALDSHVKARLNEIAKSKGSGIAWATPRSNLPAMPPNPYTPLTDERWEVIQNDTSGLYKGYQGLTREQADKRAEQEEALQREEAIEKIQPLVFNLNQSAQQVSGESSGKGRPLERYMFFTARYDGDIERWIERENKVGELRWERDPDAADDEDEVIVAADTDTAPSGYTSEHLPRWKKTTDALEAWLDSTFAAHPGLLVAETHDARDGDIGTGNRLARYPSRWRYTDQDERTRDRARRPVIDNWVAIAPGSVAVKSNMGGIMLAPGDLVVKKSRATQDTINRALAERDAPGVILDGDVYEVTPSAALKRRLCQRLPIDATDGQWELAFHLDRPDLPYTRLSSEEGEDRIYEVNHFLYAYEVAGVGADGTIEEAERKNADGGFITRDATAVATSTGRSGTADLGDPDDTLLVFVARREPKDDAKDAE